MVGAGMIGIQGATLTHHLTLAQLVASLGTPFAFSPPQGYVLFLDEVSDRVVVRDGLELHARLVRVPGLDLDLPGGNLEVEAEGPGS